MRATNVGWTRITAGCSTAIAAVHKRSASYGHLVQLPDEAAMAGELHEAKTATAARAAVSLRMSRYFQSVTIAHAVQPSKVTSLCARWRLDCVDSPLAQDIVRVHDVSLFEDDVKRDASASAYTLRDVVGLQHFANGSSDRSSHRAAYKDMMQSFDEASRHFHAVARQRASNWQSGRPGQLHIVHPMPISTASRTPRPAAAKLDTRKKAPTPSDMERSFNDMLNSLSL